MKLPRLSFTTYRDAKGYKIEGTVPPQPPRRRAAGEFLARMTYGRLGEPEGYGPWISGYIVGLSDQRLPVLLDEYPNAFTDFAAVETTTDLRNFIGKYGSLTKTKRQLAFPLVAEARQLRNAMRARKGVTFLANIVDLSASLINDGKTGELEAYLVPSSLLDALWLQFQQSTASGAVFRNCLACNNQFAVGGNSGRRPFAKFCTDECRMRFNSLARSDTKLRERRTRGHK